MMRALVAIGLLASLAGCVDVARDPSDADAPDASTTNMATLDPESFFVLPVDEAGPFRMRATVHSDGDAPFDAWLLTADDCGSLMSRPPFRAMSEMRGGSESVLTLDVPTTRGCLVLDNSADEFGGATPSGTVRVSYTIDVWR